MSFFEFRSEIHEEVPRISGHFRLDDEWIPRYKRIRDLAYNSAFTLETARLATAGGFADGQTVFAALGRAVRVVEACQKVGAEINHQWLMETRQRSYHFMAAIATADACLPFDAAQRTAIREVTPLALARQPFSPPAQLNPILQRGQVWLSGTDPDQPGFGTDLSAEFSGSCFYFDRAQAALEYYAAGTLLATSLRGDALQDFDFEEYEGFEEYGGNEDYRY